MMKRRFLSVICLLCLLTLCACTPESQSESYTKPVDQPTVGGALKEAFLFHIPSIEVEHGEDYTINWVDPGMEAYMRFLLEKPEGDILHSDVWDIQVLVIRDRGTMMLEEVPDGFDEFSFESVNLNRGLYHAIDNQKLPAVSTLEDLKHFDSLQILDVDFGTSMGSSTGLSLDITGVAYCQNLKKLTVEFMQISSLDPITQIPSLEQLILRRCGTLDLTPLQKMPNLCQIGLSSCHILSLEPLTTLPKLYSLRLGEEATYPDLEPLCRTSIKNLDMGLSVFGRDLYSDLDYTPLTNMPELVCLDLTNHVRVDTELCAAILRNNSNLKYLDIMQTAAAKTMKQDSAKLDTSGLLAFEY